MAREKENNGGEHGDPFLANIDAKIAALQQLRTSYLAALSVGVGGAGDSSAIAAASAGPSFGGQAMELPRGALLGKSLPAAIKLYLSAVKRKQTIKEIAAALKEGGVETTAANFETPITSAINRLKVSGEVLRFKDGWALAEFYPESLRNKITEKDGNATKKRAAKKAKKAKKGAAPIKASKAAPGSSVSLDDRVLTYLAKHPMQVFVSAEIAKALDVETKLVAMAFARLSRYKKITKKEDDRTPLRKP